MDDVTHNCGDCHEITRDPAHHTCGRTPEGTLPAHQPHKVAPPPVSCWDPRTWGISAVAAATRLRELATGDRG